MDEASQALFGMIAACKILEERLYGLVIKPDAANCIVKRRNAYEE